MLWALTASLLPPTPPPRQTALLSNSGPASLAACRSLAGPGRAAEAHGLWLTWSSRCQGSASRGMYGQDGMLHYTSAGKATESGEDEWIVPERMLSKVATVVEGKATKRLKRLNTPKINIVLLCVSALLGCFGLLLSYFKKA